MSNNRRRAERRAELNAQFEKEEQVRLQETRRKESLTMWERIEEAKDVSDVKEILHMLAQETGMEQ